MHLVCIVMMSLSSALLAGFIIGTCYALRGCFMYQPIDVPTSCIIIMLGVLCGVFAVVFMLLTIL